MCKSAVFCSDLDDLILAAAACEKKTTKSFTEYKLEIEWRTEIEYFVETYSILFDGPLDSLFSLSKGLQDLVELFQLGFGRGRLQSAQLSSSFLCREDRGCQLCILQRQSVRPPRNRIQILCLLLSSLSDQVLISRRIIIQCQNNFA